MGEDEQHPEEQIAERMEHVVRRFLNMPPQPHGKNPKTPPVEEKPKARRLMGRSVHLRCDANEALTAIAALRTELEIGLAGDVSQRILDLLKRPEEVFRIKTDIHPTGARKVTVRLEPSDRLAMLLAALRAGNVDRTIVEET
jgi:hypothetical protein